MNRSPKLPLASHGARPGVAHAPASQATMHNQAQHVIAGGQAAQIEALTARVEALEQLVAKLVSCTVQQYRDGRLYVPSQNPLTVDVAVNGAHYAIRAAPAMAAQAPVHSASPDAPPAGGVLVAPSSSSPPATAGSSLGQMAPPASSWQVPAASSGTADPRTTHGTPIRFP